MKRKMISLLRGSYPLDRRKKNLYKHIVDFCQETGGRLRFYGKHYSTGDELVMLEVPPGTKRIICYNDKMGYLSGEVHTPYLYYVFETVVALSRPQYNNWKRVRLFCTRKPLRNIRNKLYHVPLPNILNSGLICFDGVLGERTLIGRYRSFWDSAFTLGGLNCYKDLDLGMVPQKSVFDRDLVSVKKTCFSLLDYAVATETKNTENTDNTTSSMNLTTEGIIAGEENMAGTTIADDTADNDTTTGATIDDTMTQ